MATSDLFNPFRVLMLPTDASPADIARQGEKLRRQAQNIEEETRVREAVELLTADRRTRLFYELFEMPEAGYNDESWEAFARTQEQGSIDMDALAQPWPVPSLEDLDLATLAQMLLEELTDLSPADQDVLLNAVPYAPRYTLPVDEWENISPKHY